MSLLDAFELGYRNGFNHDAPKAPKADATLLALYAQGYREGAEDADALGDLRSSFAY